MADTTNAEHTMADWEDPEVQLVYRLLCSDEKQENPAEHWEGFIARRIVAELRVASRSGEDCK